MKKKKTTRIIAIVLSVIMTISIFSGIVISSFSASALEPDKKYSDVDVANMANEIANITNENSTTVPNEVEVPVDETATDETTVIETTTNKTEKSVKEGSSLSQSLCTATIDNLISQGNVGTIVLNFKNIKTKEKYPIEFNYDSKYVADLSKLPAGEYKISIVSLGDLEKLSFKNKSITIKSTNETQNINITIKSVRKDEGFIKNFLRQDGIVLGLLIFCIIAYVIIKKKNEA